MRRQSSGARNILHAPAILLEICVMALVVSVIGLSFSGCESGTEPPDTPRYFPLTVGNSWTYAPEDPFYGQPFEWAVTEERGDTVTLVRPPGASHSGPVTLLDHVDEIDLRVGDDEFVPFYRFAVGASWIHRDTWECDDGSRMVVVREPDPIVTPAGTFLNTVRIERQTAIPCTDAGTTVEWWAPDVGLVQWEELNFYAGGPLTFYLTDYSVN